MPGITGGMSLKDRAAATVAAGYRAFRMGDVYKRQVYRSAIPVLSKT